MTETKPEGAFPWSHIPTPGKIYGTATVGERGQISIPAEARQQLGIRKGDRLMVFGNKLNGAVVLLKADVFEDFAGFFMTKLNKLGKGTQAFFDAFIDPAPDDDDEPAEEAPAETE